MIINSDDSLHKEIKITQNGLPIENITEIEMYFKDVFLVEYLKLSHDKKSSDIIISDLVKRILRKYIKTQLGKKPEVDVHIIRL